MSFIDLGKSNPNERMLDWRVQSGVLFGIIGKGAHGHPQIRFYVYRHVLDAAGWTRETRLIMSVGVLQDAGIIRLRPSTEKHALALTAERSGDARLTVARTMNCWYLPPMKTRRPEPVKRWSVHEGMLEIWLPGAFAEELRAAQESRAAQERYLRVAENGRKPAERKEAEHA